MDILLEQERIARLEKDEDKMLQIMTQIIQNCKNDTELITYIKILSKRKAQLKEPLKQVIHNVYTYKIQNVNNDTAVFFNALLKDVIEGKFYLEDERISITNTLKEFYEQNNDDLNALSVCFSVPVETFSIDEDLKINYQLEILRLCVKLKDWTKSELISKRIRMSYFKDAKSNTAEIKFYNLMIGVFLGQSKYFEASEYFQKLYEIDKTEPSNKILYCSFFAILSNDSKKENMLKFCIENKDNTDQIRKIIGMFLGNEIIPISLSEFANQIDTIYRQDFLRSINEHNFLIVSRYFESIRFDDLKNILQCSLEECVDLICTSVNRKALNAKIDQAREIVIFGDKNKEDTEVELSKVLERLVKVNHLIHKENLKASK